MTSRICWLNAYEVEQCYGGPEEGGWYYPSGTPIASVPFELPLVYLEGGDCNCDHSECCAGEPSQHCHGEIIRATIKNCEALTTEIARLEKVFDYLVHEKRLVIEVQSHFGAFYPTETPHYE